MAKLCCSDHSLRIEVGRKSNIPADQRFCKICNSDKVENEEHFFVECAACTFHRTQLFLMIQDIVRTFPQITLSQKLIYLVMCENMIIIKEVASFVKTCMELRSNTEA